MNIDRKDLFRFFKYAVYALLALNVYWFFVEEHAAAVLQFPAGVAASELFEAYASTLDTGAWVILLLMFELETSVLEDDHFTKPVIWTLHSVRVISYVFIVSAFNGYIANLIFTYDMLPLTGVSDLCTLVTEQWSYSVDIDEYVAITASNCGDFSSNAAFLQFAGLPAVVDAQGLRDIQYLAWVDVINGGVWLLIVVVLEIDVFLQERGHLEGLMLRMSTWLKFLLYSILLIAAGYWGFKGDFVDFWDAFLWLVAFFFIELNVIEWRQESLQESPIRAESQ